MKRLVKGLLLAAALAPLATVSAHAEAPACFSDKLSSIFVIVLGLGEDATIDTAAKHRIAILMPEFASTRREYFSGWNKDDSLTICEHLDPETGNTHQITDDNTHATYPGLLDADHNSRVCLQGPEGGAICRGP